MPGNRPDFNILPGLKGPFRCIHSGRKDSLKKGTSQDDSLFFNLQVKPKPNNMKLFKPILKHWSYLADFVVIVLGILVALSLDNWNTERQRKKEEIQFLKEIRKTLEKDQIDAQVNIRQHQKSINAIDSLFIAFDNHLPYNENMIPYFSRLLSTMIFLQTEGPLNVLQSKGFDLISNDTIRSQLIRLYGMSYPAIDAMENQLPQFQHFNLLFEYIRKNFNRSSRTEFDETTNLAIEPINYKRICMDAEFRLLLAHSRKWREVSIYYYGLLIDKIKILLAAIEEEIGSQS
jgi:hypothetical protein